MYAVSDAYKAAMKQPVQHFRLRGIIDNGFGTSITFSEKNVLSFTMENQCTDSSTVKIGGVYIGELSATFTGIPKNFNWHSEQIAKYCTITSYVSRQLADGSWEEIPLGVYNVSEVTKTIYGYDIVAYDNMLQFDEEYGNYAFSGSIYDMLQLCCELCGAELGMTQSEVMALPNGKYQYFALYPENDIETYRDVLSYLAQLVCGFATIDRNGKLVLRSFQTAVTDTIHNTERLTGAKFSDFKTVYNRIRNYDAVQGRPLQYEMPVLVGSYMDLGQNPFLQYGLAEQKKVLMQNILYALSDYTSDTQSYDPAHALHYTPFQLEMLGDPAYDLGDVLSFPDGIAPDDAVGCIMSYSWEYGGSYEVAGYGSDPKLDWAKSASDKAISGLSGMIESSTMHYYSYTNAATVRIGNGSQAEVVSIRFISSKATEVNFFAEVKLNVSTIEKFSEDTCICNDGTLIAAYYIGSEEIGRIRPQWTLQDGVHTLHLFFHFSVSDVTSDEFSVHFFPKDCTISIEKNALNATMEGTYLAGDGTWDGTIVADDFYDTEISTGITEMAFHVTSDTVSERRQIPTARSITETMALLLETAPLAFGSISESISNSLAIARFLLDAADNAGEYDAEIMQIVDGLYKLADESITGSIQKTADLSDEAITGITSFDCTYTGILFVQYSYDGETWTEKTAISDFLAADPSELYSGLTDTKTIGIRLWLEGNATLTEFAINYAL